MVCGAGNEDVMEVEKLVALYAKAGANYFDLSAKEDVVRAAQKGLKKAIPSADLKNYHLNVSVGIKGDPHVSKARIDMAKCTSCGKCDEDCPQQAIIVEESTRTINLIRCIGCGRCVAVCPEKAIKSFSQTKPLDEVLPPLVDLGISSIEFHAVSNDEAEIFEQWKVINKHFDGILSICIDRSNMGDNQLIKRVQRAIENRKEFSTIVQADGAPMSGSDDNYETTLQTLATAQIVQKANLPVYLMLSGGTNSKTTELAKLFKIPIHGIAIGSYARKIVRNYIQTPDFLNNEESFNKALSIASELVSKSLKYMGE